MNGLAIIQEPVTSTQFMNTRVHLADFLPNISNDYDYLPNRNANHMSGRFNNYNSTSSSTRIITPRINDIEDWFKSITSYLPVVNIHNDEYSGNGAGIWSDSSYASIIQSLGAIDAMKNDKDFNFDGHHLIDTDKLKITKPSNTEYVKVRLGEERPAKSLPFDEEDLIFMENDFFDF